MFYPRKYNLTEPLEYYRRKDTLIDENNLLKEQLEFYKSIFNMRNSCIYNLSIKKKNGKKVWFDSVLCTEKELLELDSDDEINDMIYNPPKPER
tara:strand:+ start:1052 stop:1333 length:282 start_codon:yes stop_codon:yes gene_type:complete